MFFSYTTPEPPENNQSHQQQPQPQQPQPVTASKIAVDNLLNAQAKNTEALARINEANAKIAEAQAVMAQAQILLNGMNELRMALHLPSVDENQNQVTEKTTLKPMFNESNVENIQINYMILYKKYEDFSSKAINKYTKDLAQ